MNGPAAENIEKLGRLDVYNMWMYIIWIIRIIFGCVSSAFLNLIWISRFHLITKT